MAQESGATGTVIGTRPIVIKVRHRNRSRRRHSRGLSGIQTMSRGMARASYRLTNAVAEGMRTYLRESDRSARRKRDGMARDFGLNVADALGTTLSESRDIPRELARSMYTRDTRRMMRRSLNMAARFNRRLLRMR